MFSGIIQARELLFHSVKMSFSLRVLQKASYDVSQPSVTLDRLLLTAKGEKDKGTTGKQNEFERIMKRTAFGIAFEQLAGLDPKLFRKKKPTGTDPHFSLKINFHGENVQGDSGPYRQFFSDVAQELQSDALPFFVPCPNALTGSNRNRDKFILAPSRCRSKEDLSFLRFLGVLMGMAMRTSVLLPLDLPSFFWRSLVGEDPSLDDLRQIDESINGLNAIRMSEREMWEEGGESRSFYETFECTLGDGTRVPLCPGGSDVSVTYKTRLQYCELVEKTRLKESVGGLVAISEGLCTVVPSCLLRLYSWEQLSWRICGRPFIDVDLLRRHTKYGNVSVAMRQQGASGTSGSKFFFSPF